MISKETQAACLEEIEAAIEHFNTQEREPYDSGEYFTQEWHRGWECAAQQANETLIWLRNRLQEETANA